MSVEIVDGNNLQLDLVSIARPSEEDYQQQTRQEVPWKTVSFRYRPANPLLHRYTSKLRAPLHHTCLCFAVQRWLSKPLGDLYESSAKSGNRREDNVRTEPTNSRMVGKQEVIRFVVESRCGAVV